MIDVMIITYNEALNLPHCLAALQGWAKNIFVIDSGSTDETQSIARSFGATVVPHAWEGYSRQKNWGLANLPFESQWVLIVDADEVITVPLRNQLLNVVARPIDHVRENGYFLNRLTYFIGRPIRHCGYFPNWNLRFFKRGKGVYEDRDVHEHIIIDDPVGYLKEPMLHDDRRGLEHYIAKHNRYSTLEARTLFHEIADETREPAQGQRVNVPAETQRRRWLKRHVMPRVPFPGLWRFMYMYFICLGILDGRTGFEFCKFISMYDSMVAMKLRELKRSARQTAGARAGAGIRGLSMAEGDDAVVPQDIRLPIEPPQPGPPTQMQPEASPWTFKEKVRRAVWMLLGKPIFRASFHNWYTFRVAVLRFFGAKIGQGVAIRPTANVEVPWMLEIDDDATIGDYAILYSLGKIKIGKRSIVSQYAHLCAGTHDYSDHTFRLIRAPIIVGDDVWIGADAFVGPGVRIGNLSVLGARSSAYKDLPEHKVCVGNPAKPLHERVLK